MKSTYKFILLIIFSAFVITGCGPSEEEKKNNLLLERQKIQLEREEVASITCNILYESSILGGAQRIKEINIAREKLNERKFLGRDEQIQEAFEYDLCFELVLNDDFQNKLELAKREKREEEERLAELEKKRSLIEAQETLRLANLKRKELEKRVKEEAKIKQEALSKWGKELYVKINQGIHNITVIDPVFEYDYSPKLKFRISCRSLVRMLKGKIIVTFKDGYEITESDLSSGCNYKSDGFFEFSRNGLSAYILEAAQFQIKDISLAVSGLTNRGYEVLPELKPTNYDLSYSTLLEVPLTFSIYSPLEFNIPIFVEQKLPRISNWLIYRLTEDSAQNNTNFKFKINSKGKAYDISAVETRCQTYNPEVCQEIVKVSKKALTKSEFVYNIDDKDKIFYATYAFKREY